MTRDREGKTKNNAFFIQALWDSNACVAGAPSMELIDAVELLARVREAARAQP